MKQESEEKERPLTGPQVALVGVFIAGTVALVRVMFPPITIEPQMVQDLRAAVEMINQVQERQERIEKAIAELEMELNILTNKIDARADENTNDRSK